MSGSIATRAIAGSALGGDDDWEIDAETGYRRKRVRVIMNRYGRIGMDPADGTEIEPTPTYDALPPDKRMAVDALVVAVRMSQPKGDV